MTFEDFIKRVQAQAGLTASQARQAVEATLGVLRDSLTQGGPAGLPEEIRQALGESLWGAGALPGQPPAQPSANPQFAGQARVESGGESSAETGQ